MSFQVGLKCLRDESITHLCTTFRGGISNAMDCWQNITRNRILYFKTFFIIWLLNVCIGFIHNTDTEKNNASNWKNFCEIVLGMLNLKVLHE